MLIKVEVSGLPPGLLMHKFNDGDLDKGSTATIQARDRLPREAAERAAYKLEDGSLYWPCANLFSALVDAGSQIKVAGARGAKLTTAKASLVPAGLAIVESVALFHTKQFEVDSKRIVNPNTGQAAICHRARLDKWSFAFTLDIDEKMFSAQTVRELVDVAGRQIGIGAFRPRRRGPYGRFNVTKWEPQAVKAGKAE